MNKEAIDVLFKTALDKRWKLYNSFKENERSNYRYDKGFYNDIQEMESWYTIIDSFNMTLNFTNYVNKSYLIDKISNSFNRCLKDYKDDRWYNNKPLTISFYTDFKNIIDSYTVTSLEIWDNTLFFNYLEDKEKEKTGFGIWFADVLGLHYNAGELFIFVSKLVASKGMKDGKLHRQTLIDNENDVVEEDKQTKINIEEKQ